MAITPTGGSAQTRPELKELQKGSVSLEFYNHQDLKFSEFFLTIFQKWNVHYKLYRLHLRDRIPVHPLQ
jgi:hypothetical protein